MKLFTYTAETSTLALAEAKKELGDEFSIISQKKLADGNYEISVAISEEDLKQVKERQELAQKENLPLVKSNNIAERLELIAQKELERKRAAQSLQSLPEEVSLQLSDAVRQISQIAGVNTKIPPKSPYKPKEKSSRDEKIEKSQAPSNSLENTKAKKQENPQDSVNLQIIRGEIDKLNDKIKLIQNMIWEERGPKKEGLIITHEFAEL